MPDVGGVDGRSVDPYEYLGGAGFGARGLREAEYLGSAETGLGDGSHDLLAQFGLPVPCLPRHVIAFG